MSELTPGKETSEFETIKKVGLWVRIVSGMLAAAGTALLASGQLAEGTQPYVWIGMVVTVLGAIGGEFAQSIKYTQSRTAVKLNEASTSALKDAAKSDPT